VRVRGRPDLDGQPVASKVSWTTARQPGRLLQLVAVGAMPGCPEGRRTRHRGPSGIRLQRVGVDQDMTDKPVKLPGPDHPITVEPAASRVVVRAGGKTIADTRRALTLQEGHYPAVYYVPREDADLGLLGRTDHHTYCPYKGDASYYSILPAGQRGTNAVWTYEAPYDAVNPIKDHLAFYPDRVDAIDVLPL
jgi:uncharacterized protein (DUF427 family)